MSKILLGVSASIAAYKALELVRLATGAGHAVRVVQTPASQRFVGAASFQALTGAPVLYDEFAEDPLRGAFPGEQPPDHQPLSHLELVAKADLYLVAPASANTLAKLAAGAADSLLTSCALAATCPLAVAPAMNNRMYEHPATQTNLRVLRERGVHVIEPGSGRLASIGEQGVGRLAEPERLLEECERLLEERERPLEERERLLEERKRPLEERERLLEECERPLEERKQPLDGGARESLGARATTEDLRGLRVLITAGGTREPLDSVRFLGNSSSGRMGLALAETAARRGAHVTLIAANIALPVPDSIELVRVGTAEELKDACEQHFPDCDVLLMAAAVADFRPAEAHAGKIKKGGRDGLKIELVPTEDVISALAAKRSPDQTLVAFAAEHGPQGLASAREKLTAKRVDAVVFNDISRSDIGFESTENEVTILTADGAQPVALASKHRIADSILDVVARLRHSP